MVQGVEANGRHEVAKLIERALAEKSRNQAWLGAEVAKAEGRPNPYSQAAVNGWLDNIDGQLAARIFHIEDALGLVGKLSRPLGFERVGTRSIRSVADAIKADPRLDEHARQALLLLYQHYAKGA